MKKLLIALVMALSIGVSGSALAQQNWCSGAQDIAIGVYMDRFTKGTPRHEYDNLIARERQKASPQQTLLNKRINFMQTIVNGIYEETSVRPWPEDIQASAYMFGLLYFSMCNEEGLQ